MDSKSTSDAAQQTVTHNWRQYLMTGESPVKVLGFSLSAREFRRLAQKIPSDPRCIACRTPFNGAGGTLMRLLGRRPSRLNPRLCDFCDQYIRANVGGAEIELTMLFADVRGSTSLAEATSPAEYSRIINRFFQVASDTLVQADALIEKLIGDEVAAMFVPGFAGPLHSARAIDTARKILRATGHGRADGPWIPVGIGVHRGLAFVGAVGTENGVADIVALGDAVNTAARLASLAGAGEIFASRETLEAAPLAGHSVETRQLQLKGKSQPIEIGVLR